MESLESFYYGKVPAAKAGKVHEGRVIAHLEKQSPSYVKIIDATNSPLDFQGGIDVVIEVYDGHEKLLFVPVDLKSYGPTRAVGHRIYGDNCREITQKILSAVNRARERALAIKAKLPKGTKWRPWEVTIAKYWE